MKQKKRNKGRTALIILCVILTIILIFGIVVTFFTGSILSMIGRLDRNPTDESGNVITSPTDESIVSVLDEPILNILFIGQDRREGQGVQRSDSMILCTINKEKNTLTMTSFMRDMYVEIPGHYSNRINVAYTIGGFQLLDETIEKNFDVDVFHNVEVDVFGFIDVIDALGGIDLELTDEEAAYLNRWGNWDYTNDRDWALHGGVNHLTGTQTVAYCRIRDLGTDFERTNRQRKVLLTVLDDVKSMGVTEAYKFLEKVLPMISTDMSDADILSYALVMLPRLSKLQIISQRIPADGAYSNQTIDGMMVLVPDLEKNKELLNSTIK